MKNSLCQYVLTLITGLFISISATAMDKTEQLEPLLFQIFIHDDIPQSEHSNIHPGYFAWLIKDLESFTQRKVFLKFVKNMPPFTNYPYQGDNLDNIIWGWKQVVNEHIEQARLPRSKFRKYLLLTNHPINSTTLGMADSTKKLAAIASLSSYSVPAHELGHLLNGTHEAAEVRFTPWPCETNLDAKRTIGFAPCKVYSDANKLAITRYLNEVP